MLEKNLRYFKRSLNMDKRELNAQIELDRAEK